MPASLCLALLHGAARADSWSPYGERLEVAENGKHFIVLGPYDYEKRSTAFAIHERGVGAKSPHVIQNELDDESKVVVDPGDRLIRKGQLKQQPLDAWMLSVTRRAVLFEEYGSVGGDTTLSLLQADGKMRWRHSLADFKFQAGKFKQSVSSLWWHEGWWVDEARGRIVLVAKGRQYREVELETGKIHDAEESVVLDALKSRSGLVRSAVLQLCASADEKPKGWVKRVTAFRDDKSQSLPDRLEAAWAVCGKGDDGPALAIFQAAQKDLSNEKVRIAFLPVGETRLELLEPTADDSPIARFLERRGEGIHHLCFQVDDIEAALERFKKAGVALVDEKPRAGAGGTRVAFIHPRGMAGVLVELVEKERP